ncbi:PLAC8-domain-containing protein [Thozetella sp. PMI_491]|nr:PLAC8-domain-containing protein [Thozetella sp. PMI_491]
MAYPQHEHQPNYAQGQNVTSQDWSSSLFDCSPCDTCLLGTCLPCVLLGKTSERMRDPTNPSPELVNTDCMLMCGIMYFTGCGWIYALIKRGEIRERYGLKGDGMGDCCATYWCPCCALIQQDKEVQMRSAAGPIVQGYQSEKGMTVPGQQPQAAPQGYAPPGEYHQQGQIQYQQQPQYQQQQQQQPQYHQQ